MSTTGNTSLVYVGLGSNLKNPQQQVLEALEEINNLGETELLSTSSWYRSKPQGPGEQPDYINGVALVKTTLTPHEFLKGLQSIENLHGRERNERWGPRTLDLDILLFGDLVISTVELEVPHPRLPYRNFVLIPLAELSPNLLLPDKKPLSDLLAKASTKGIVRIACT